MGKEGLKKDKEILLLYLYFLDIFYSKIEKAIKETIDILNFFIKDEKDDEKKVHLLKMYVVFNSLLKEVVKERKKIIRMLEGVM